MFTTPKKNIDQLNAATNYFSPLQGIQGIFRAVVGSPTSPNPNASLRTGPGGFTSPISPPPGLGSAPAKQQVKRKRCLASSDQACECSIGDFNVDSWASKARPNVQTRAMAVDAPSPLSPSSPSPLPGGMPPPMSFPERGSNSSPNDHKGQDDVDINPTPSKRPRTSQPQGFRTPARPSQHSSRTRTPRTPHMGSRDPPAGYEAFPMWSMRTTPIRVGSTASGRGEKTRVKVKEEKAHVERKVKVEDAEMDELPTACSQSPEKAKLTRTTGTFDFGCALPKSSTKARKAWIPIDRDEELEMNFANLSEDVHRAFKDLGTSHSSSSPTKPRSSRSTSSSTDASTPGFTRSPSSSSSSDESGGPSTPLTRPIDVDIDVADSNTAREIIEGIDEDAIFHEHFISLSKQHIKTTRLVDPVKAERVRSVVESHMDTHTHGPDSMPETVKVNAEGLSGEMLKLKEQLDREREWSQEVMERNLKRTRPQEIRMPSEPLVSPTSKPQTVKGEKTDVPRTVQAEDEALLKARAEEHERQRQAQLEEIRRVQLERVQQEKERVNRVRRLREEKERREREEREAASIAAALKEKTRLRREREEREAERVARAEAERRAKEEAEFMRRQHLERERLMEQRDRIERERLARVHAERFQAQQEAFEAQRLRQYQEDFERHQAHLAQLESARLARIQAEAHARLLAAETERLQRLAEEERSRRVMMERAYMWRMEEEQRFRQMAEDERMRRAEEDQREIDDVLMRDGSFYIPPKQHYEFEQPQPQQQRPTGLRNQWCDVDASMSSIPDDRADVDVDIEDLPSGPEFAEDSGYGSTFGSQSSSSSTSPTSEYEGAPMSEQPAPEPVEEEPEVEEQEPQPYFPTYVPSTNQEWFDLYEERWSELTVLVTSSSSSRTRTPKLTFSHIPWPSFSHHTSLSTLTEARIREFFMLRYPAYTKLDKKMWMKDLKRWHTDKVGRMAGLLWEGPRGQMGETEEDGLRQEVHEGFLRCIKVMNGLKGERRM